MYRQAVFACLAFAMKVQAELTFTEYMEGSGYNKAVEIANVGSAPHDFAVEPRSVVIFRSGDSERMDRQILIDSGLLLPNKVLVVANPGASELLSSPQLLDVHVVVDAALNFNGDDTVALLDVATGTIKDMIGALPMTSSWLKDVTIRKDHTDTATRPAGFPCIAAPWVAFESDAFSGFGCIGTTAPCTTPKLLFTEYMEGSFNNKAVEIGNVGNAAWDFVANPVVVAVYRSGENIDREIEINSGSLEEGEVLIVAHSGAVDLLTGVAPGVRIVVGNLDFNGNDAVALIEASGTIDMIGSLPMASSFLEVVTIRRKAISTNGAPNGFTSIASPWVAFGKDEAGGFGCMGEEVCLSDGCGVNAPQGGVYGGVELTDEEAYRILVAANHETAKTMTQVVNILPEHPEVADAIVAARPLCTINDLLQIPGFDGAELSFFKIYIISFGCYSDDHCAGDNVCRGIPFDGIVSSGKCISLASIPGQGASCGFEMFCEEGLLCAGMTFPGATQGNCRPLWMGATFTPPAHLVQVNMPAETTTEEIFFVVNGLASVPEDIVLTLDASAVTNQNGLTIVLSDPNGSTATFYDGEATPTEAIASEKPMFGSISRDDTVNGKWSLRITNRGQAHGLITGFQLYITSRWD